MEHRQAFLGRIVDIGAELFAISAACVKARAERDEHPEGMELADLFSRQAKHRADALFAELWSNTDAVDVKAAKRVVAGRYTFLEDGIIPPPTEGDRVQRWQQGESTETDVRRRL
jgi:hypothetical protein